MKTIKMDCWTYVPTGEIEVSQRKRVYKAYFLDEFVGYRVKVPTVCYGKNGKPKKEQIFKKCEKVYEDINGKLKFIVC